MASPLSKSLRYAVFVGIAGGLLWLAFRETDPKSLWANLAGADYRFILLSMTMGYVAYISRGLRWNLLLECMGYRAKKASSIHSVAIGYLANMAVPRAGEVARCTALNRLEDIPVSKLLGTVVLERAIDFLMLFLFLGGVLLTSYADFLVFYEKASGAETAASGESNTAWLIGALLFFIFMVVLGWMWRGRIQSHPAWQKIKDFASGLAEGFKTLSKIDKKGLFILHTLIIWAMYFFMVYICIFALPETSGLSYSNMLFVMVAAAMGMVVPVPGGVGAYHYLVVLSMSVLGVSETVGLSFATLVHSGQTLMGIISGAVGFLFLTKKGAGVQRR